MLEAVGRPVLGEAGDGAQLRRQLAGMVDDGRAGEGKAQDVGPEALGELEHRARAPRLWVLYVVGLIEDEGLRLQFSEPLDVRVDDVVVDYDDVGVRRVGA